MISKVAFLPLATTRGRVYDSTLATLRLKEREMLKLGLFARLEAKPGKEEAVAAFLMQGLQLANQETTTPAWFALRLGPTTFAIFDAFHDEAGRQSHLTGPIAKALMAQAATLLAAPPVIERVEVLGAKLSA
jgi:quinol monooxygenase YgiN